MALTTDESYSTVAYADTWHANRGNTSWALLTATVKEQSLRKSTDYLESNYIWKGTRVNNTQVLSFPRYGIYVDGYLVNSESVPIAIQSACAEMALKASTSELMPDLERTVLIEKVDVLEITYDKSSLPYVRYRAIDNMLRDFICGYAGSINKAVIRT